MTKEKGQLNKERKDSSALAAARLARELASKKFLLFLEKAVDSGHCTKEQILDILKVCHSALHSNNGIIITEKILDLHAKFLSYFDFDNAINKAFFENLVLFFEIDSLLQSRKTVYDSANFERKLMLLLESYVIKDNVSFTASQFEVILEFLELSMQRSVSFPFIFMFIKISEILKEAKIDNPRVKALFQSISNLILTHPEEHSDMDKIKHIVNAINL